MKNLSQDFPCDRCKNKGYKTVVQDAIFYLCADHFRENQLKGFDVRWYGLGPDKEKVRA